MLLVQMLVAMTTQEYEGGSKTQIKAENRGDTHASG